MKQHLCLNQWKYFKLFPLLVLLFNLTSNLTSQSICKIKLSFSISETDGVQPPYRIYLYNVVSQNYYSYYSKDFEIDDIKVDTSMGSYLLFQVETNEHETDTLRLNLTKGKSEYLTTVSLGKKLLTYTIDEVVISTSKPKITNKNDTIVYSLKEFRDSTERRLYELLNKLPGIEADGVTGNIRYQGIPIETVLIDGDNVFGKSYQNATKLLNPTQFINLEVIQNYEENRILASFNNSEKIALNLTITDDAKLQDLELAVGSGLKNTKRLVRDNILNHFYGKKKLKSFNIATDNNFGVDYFSAIGANLGNGTTGLSPAFIGNSPLMFLNREYTLNTSSQVVNSSSIIKFGSKVRVRMVGLLSRMNNINETLGTSNLIYREDSISWFENIKALNGSNTFGLSSNLIYDVSKKMSFESLVFFKRDGDNRNNNIRSSNTFTSLVDSKLRSNIISFQPKVYNIISKKLLNVLALNVSRSELAEQTNFELSPLSNKTLLNQKVDKTSTTLSATNELRYKGDSIINQLFVLGGFKYSNSPFLSMLENTNPSIPQAFPFNDFSFVHQEFYIESFAKVSLHKSLILRVKSSVNSITLENMMNDRASDSIAKIVFQPLLTLEYRFTKNNSLRGGYSKSNSLPNADVIANGITLNGHRNATFSNSKLNIFERKTLFISHNYTNLYNQFYIKSAFTINEIDGRYASNIVLGDQLSFNRYFLNNQPLRENNLAFNTEKFLSKVSSTLRGGYSLNRIISANSINDNSVRLNTSTASTYFINIENYLLDTWNIILNNRFISNKVMTPEGQTYTFSSYGLDASSKISFRKNINLILSYSSFLPDISDKKNYYQLLDAEIYTTLKRHDIFMSLKVNNILNQKSFGQITSNDLGISSFSYSIPGRFVSLSVGKKII